MKPRLLVNEKLRMMKKIWVIVLAVLLFSCTHNRLNVDISNINVDLKINRIEKLIFVKDTAAFSKNINFIETNYKEFFDIYTKHVLQIGTSEGPNFRDYLGAFVKDTVISRVADSVNYVFNDFSKIEKQLVKGFKHYKYYFPNSQIPQVYTCVTGFNQSIFIGTYGIAVGLDKYLSSDCIFYDYLGIPKYKCVNMYPEKIVPDLFYSLCLTEFPGNDSVNNLLSNMIYQGKALYFTKAMCPALPDSIIMGYSAKQLKWCSKNEQKMWEYLVEKKLLYNSERLTLQKFIGDAPFTNVFSEESPGRTGLWLGWRIVSSFMNKNKDITLNELMTMNNAQSILNRSGYFPE
jgi:hypothetical protein